MRKERSPPRQLPCPPPEKNVARPDSSPAHPPPHPLPPYPVDPCLPPAPPSPPADRDKEKQRSKIASEREVARQGIYSFIRFFVAAMFALCLAFFCVVYKLFTFIFMFALYYMLALNLFHAFQVYFTLFSCLFQVYINFFFKLCFMSF